MAVVELEYEKWEVTPIMIFQKKLRRISNEKACG
jgi:hypothetical protein